jgi:hypothetical protein
MGPLVRALLTLGILGALAAVVARWRRRSRGVGSLPHIPADSWPPVPRSPTGAREPVANEPGPDTNSRGRGAPVSVAEESQRTDLPDRRPKSAAKRSGNEQRWVEAEGRGCPPSHPIKAKIASGIYHRPRMAAYNRTLPDRCYATEEDAEADGFRQAKR